MCILSDLVLILSLSARWTAHAYHYGQLPADHEQGPTDQFMTKKASTVFLLTPLQSQAVQVGQHIFVSGQIPADKNGNLVEGSIADKTKASCEGMKAILEEAGSSMSKVIKVSLSP